MGTWASRDTLMGGSTPGDDVRALGTEILQVRQDSQASDIWGFPKIRGTATLLGVPIISILVYLGLYWGPLILGNYHMGFPRIRSAFWGVLIRGWGVLIRGIMVF